MYAFAVTKGPPVGRVYHRFTSCDYESCSVGVFDQCLNREFLGAWSDRFLTVKEDIQPTVQEELQAQIDNQLDTYRRSNLSPFFVMYVQKGCDFRKCFCSNTTLLSQLDSLMIQLSRTKQQSVV